MIAGVIILMAATRMKFLIKNLFSCRG